MSNIASPKFQFANLPFKQQIEYFAKKINLPTDSYLDLYGKEHDYFFAVAGANKIEVLSELRNAIDKAIIEGGNIDEFRKNFDAIVAKTGWQYKGGRNWRTRVIFDTNIYDSYNRGRLEQQLDLAEYLPYWEYRHNDRGHPRKEHQSWDGLILRYDDPWWQYHYPVKAYGCHCTVQALDEVDLKHMGKTVSKAPPIEYQLKNIGVRSGNPQLVQIPVGTDYGFAQTDFKHLTAQRNANIDKVLMQKLTTANPKFASRAVKHMLATPSTMKLLNDSQKSMVERVLKDGVRRGENRLVGAIPEDVIQKLEEKGLPPQSAIIAVRDSDILHSLRDNKTTKDINLPVEFWKNLPEKLTQADAILLQTKGQQRNKKATDTLLYIFETEHGKVVVKMDYEIQVEDIFKNEKRKSKLNLIRTGSVFKDKTALQDFEVLWGSL